MLSDWGLDYKPTEGGGPQPSSFLQPGYGTATQPSAEPARSDFGKFNIDIHRILGDVGGAVGGAGEAVGGVVGGALGLVGTGLVTAAEVLDIPRRELIEKPVARARLEAAREGVEPPFLAQLPARIAEELPAILPIGGQVIAALREQGAAERGTTRAAEIVQGVRSIPIDIAERLDAGENIDELANELVRRGEGLTSEREGQLVASFFLDPLWVIGPVAGKGLRTLGLVARNFEAAKGLAASDLIASEKALAEMGVGKRVIGRSWSYATHGMTDAQTALTSRVFGKTTLGAIRSIGVRNYLAFRKRLGQSVNVDDDLSVGFAQLELAVMAKRAVGESNAVITVGGQKVPLRTLIGKSGIQINEELRQALAARKLAEPGRLQRDIEHLSDVVKPRLPAGQIEDFVVQRVAALTGLSREGARALFGKTISAADSHLASQAAYGRAIKIGNTSKRGLAGVSRKDLSDLGQPIDDITPISERTLTVERNAALIEKMTARGTDKTKLMSEAIERYDDLYDRLGSAALDSKAFLKVLRSLEGTLPTAMREAGAEPIHRLHPLLSQLRQDWRALGYDIGFRPQNPVRTFGDEIVASLWVDTVAEGVPLTVRNPFGRFMEALFRGTSQIKIIQTARGELVNEGAKVGITPRISRAIFQDLLGEASEANTTLRALAYQGRGPGKNAIEAIFEKHLGVTEFATWRQRNDATYMFMRALRGQWDQMGLTQRFTGGLKAAPYFGGKQIARIADEIWPTLRFRFSPYYQIQEKIESVILPIMRGVDPTAALDPRATEMYQTIGSLRVEGRMLMEAYGGLYLSDAHVVTREFGRFLRTVMWPFTDVKAFKDRVLLRQISAEAGPEFERLVNRLDPVLWQRMVKAYGTEDGTKVMFAFFEERGRFAAGEGTKVVDALKPTFASADEETVWQALRAAFAESERTAVRTHYFSPERNFLNRSLNHVLLGLYPASYMWGKVLPEFARFLLKRPFGLRAPLVGYQATHRVQQALVVAQETDPEFAEYVKNNHDTLRLLTLLMPAGPLGTDFPANFAAPIRHIGARALGAKQISDAFIQREAEQFLIYQTGPLQSVRLGWEGILKPILDRAAQMYDTSVPRTAPPGPAQPVVFR